MIYAIANEHGVKIPSFFGYMIWSAQCDAAAACRSRAVEHERQPDASLVLFTCGLATLTTREDPADARSTLPKSASLPPAAIAADN